MLRVGVSVTLIYRVVWYRPFRFLETVQLYYNYIIIILYLYHIICIFITIAAVLDHTTR